MRLIDGAQLAVHQGEPPRLLGELRRVGVGADLGDLRPPGAGDDEAAREQLVAGLLDDRSASPVSSDSSISRFVGDEHLGVGDDLLPGDEVDDVVEHELVDGDGRDARRRGRR